MHLSLSMIQCCSICGCSVEDHGDDCPFKMLDAVMGQACHISCPICNGGLEINTDDYYECRNCGTRFCSGSVVVGFDTSTLKEHVLVDLVGNQPIYVYKIPERGAGKFKIDLKVAACPQCGWCSVCDEGSEIRVC